MATSSVWATGDLDKTSVVATASYVDSAYNALSTSKQEKLSSTNVTYDSNGSSNAGAVVTAVSANNGAITVTKSDLAVPVKSNGSVTGTAAIWFE